MRKHRVFKSNYAFCKWRVRCPVRDARFGGMSLGFHLHEDALYLAANRLCCDGIHAK